ncbi:MAG: M1 family aminopeptidase, partial [Polyangiales bacterium]
FEYDAAFGEGSSGLYRVKVGNDWYAWTQLEAIDARQVFPGFDQPEYKTPFTISLTTRTDHVAVTNEAELRATPLPAAAGKPALTRHEYAPTAPLPTYLLAIAVGPFDVLEGTVPANAQRDKPLPLRMIATRGNKARLAYGLAETKPIVALLEAYFGRAFPYSKLDQIASPVMDGAMENAGAVIYGDSLLLIDDHSPVQTRQLFGSVVAHELAHQWFGDLVTPVWWEDIWLNESFATWLGYRISERWKPELNVGPGGLLRAFNAMELDSLHEGRPIHQPIRTSGEIDSAFDQITYGKGGKVIDMIESYLGADKFQKGVRLYMQRFAGRNASSNDFFQALADAANEPRIVAAMQSFVEQQGVPVIRVERSGAALSLHQSRYAPLGAAAPAATTWIVPFCVRTGSERRCSMLDAAEGSVALAPSAAKLAFVPNEGGHGYYRVALSDADWRGVFGQAAQLTTGEALAVLDSVWAQWRAGGVSLGLLLEASRAFAGHADSYVAVDVGQRLSSLRLRGLLPAAQLPAYRQLMNELFGPRLQKLGLDPKLGAHAKDHPDTQRLRTRLVHFLAVEARDAAVSSKLASAAELWLGGDESALDRALLSDALTVWLTGQSLPGLPRVWQRYITSDDSDLRERVLSAVTELDDPAVARWTLDHFYTERAVRSTEKLHVVINITRAPNTRDLGLDWMVKNFQKLTKELNLASVGGLFLAPANFCSEADAVRIERGLRPHVDALKRGVLPFKRLVENVRNCAALQRARSSELTATFSTPPKVDATLR